MGLKGLPVISRELQAHGMSGDTPAALVQQGTTHQQRVFTGTVASLPAIVEREQPVPPTLIIVGGWYNCTADCRGSMPPAESMQEAASTAEH